MIAKKENPSLHWLAVVAVVFVMVCAFAINRHKAHLTEAMHLPYYAVNLEEIADGVYAGKTYTSFLHVQLEVEVQNHQITDIKVLENEGVDGEKARPILQEMIDANKVVVPAIKGAEMGSMVYISCVSTALTQTQQEQEAAQEPDVQNEEPSQGALL